MVSVIIPFFNAKSFLKSSVESCHDLPEVSEVILIDDGSSDGSFSLAIDLQKSYKKIKLFHHEYRKNKGAAESRNLGLKKATSKYVGAGLYAFYALAIIAIGAMALSGIKKIFIIIINVILFMIKICENFFIIKCFQI